jgi:hypothetical protein
MVKLKNMALSPAHKVARGAFLKKTALQVKLSCDKRAFTVACLSLFHSPSPSTAPPLLPPLTDVRHVQIKMTPRILHLIDA